MTSDRITLPSRQRADLQRALRERVTAALAAVAAGPQAQPLTLPLPACPECDAVTERIDSMVEPPEFEQYDRAVLVNFGPCGHRFRAVVGLDHLPEQVRPAAGSEPRSST